MPTENIPRRTAAHLVAGAIQDRTHFLVALSLSASVEKISALAARTPLTAYLDYGRPEVTRTEEPRDLVFAALATQGSALLLIPKTVPYTVLAESLQVPVQEDGLRELLDLEYDHWPSLMHEALTLADPLQAAMAEVHCRRDRPVLVSATPTPGLPPSKATPAPESEK